MNQPLKSDNYNKPYRVCVSLINSVTSMLNFTINLHISLYMKSLFCWKEELFSSSSFLRNMKILVFKIYRLCDMTGYIYNLQYEHILGTELAKCNRDDDSNTCKSEKPHLKNERGWP